MKKLLIFLSHHSPGGPGPIPGLSKRLILIFAVAVFPLLAAAFPQPSCFSPLSGGTGNEDSLLVMFWNLENFFDYTDGGYSASDAEFSAFGSRHWSRKKFYAKCNAIAKSVLWLSGQEGRLPDIIAVAEVENRYVLSQLLVSTLLRKLDYSIVHYESSDWRGIDVALLYRKTRLHLDGSRPCRVNGMSVSESGDTSRLVTRDILETSFSLIGCPGTRFSCLVNHHPSKYGGGNSDWRRQAAINCLASVIDSLQSSGIETIIATGDFNDTPDNVAFKILEAFPHNMTNLALPFHKRGEGSIRYNGKWELIDLFFVSENIAGASTMKIVRIPFLMTWDKVHPGYKPLRTYTGPRYNGGVSDHCPVLLWVSLPEIQLWNAP